MVKSGRPPRHNGVTFVYNVQGLNTAKLDKTESSGKNGINLYCCVNAPMPPYK